MDRCTRSRVGARLRSLAAATLLALVTPAIASATVFTVASGDVPGLIAAIAAANATSGTDTIDVTGGTYNLGAVDNTSPSGPNGLPIITSSIIFEGASATIARTGGSPFRIFEVGAGGILTLRGLTVTGGAVSNNQDGAGINLTGTGATLMLVDATVSNNTGALLGGGIEIVGTGASATLTRSTVTGNSAQEGGGIQLEGGSETLTLINSTVSANIVSNANFVDGGGIASSSNGNAHITLVGTTVDGNQAIGLAQQGAEGGGMSDESVDVITIVDSTFSNNIVHAAGGETLGGGFVDEGGSTVTIVNSTFSGNAVTITSGPASGGAMGSHAGGSFTLVSSTVTNNSAATGGGIDNVAGTVTLRNTILAGNAGGSPDCSGVLTSQGHNVIQSTTGCTVSLAPGDVSGQGAGLGPLASNGGPTKTHALQVGSPAIDAVDAAGCTNPQGGPLTSDQRGAPRPQGTACDIGAVERDVAGEICDNCIDDDGDMLIDGDDPDCPPPAGGGGKGLGDPKGRGKAAVKCAKTIEKAGAAFDKSTLGRLQKCVESAGTCVQQKEGNAACVLKARAGCDKGIGGLASNATKLTGAIVKACGAPGLTAADLLAATGVGFGGASAPCARFGIATVATATDVASCVARQHECHVEQMLGSEVPRAAELLALAGHVAAVEFPCIPAESDAGGAGLGDPKGRGKSVVGCTKAVDKATTKFVAAKEKIVQKCTDAVQACLQGGAAGDPDATCIAKARTTCAKQVAQLTDPAKGAEARLVASAAKACATVAPADLLGAAGLGFTGHVQTCAALGVPSLATASNLGTCVMRLHECRAEQLLDGETPRLRELLGVAQVTLP